MLFRSEPGVPRRDGVALPARCVRGSASGLPHAITQRVGPALRRSGVGSDLPAFPLAVDDLSGVVPDPLDQHQRTAEVVLPVHEGLVQAQDAVLLDGSPDGGREDSNLRPPHLGISMLSDVVRYVRRKAA